MNNERRKALEIILNAIDLSRGELETILEAEQESFDSMPEGLQQGEKGEKAQAAIDAITEAMDACETAVEAIETARS